MRSRGYLLVLLACAAVVGSVAFLAAGNASGANAGTGATGCTCHSAEPDPQATVVIEDLPAHAEAGTSYNLTLRLEGPDPLPAPAGANAGGFAMHVDQGNLTPGDDASQLKGQTLTHTAAGNDQRSWPFTWVAPAVGDVQATFYFAGNAVNGNRLNDDLDAWNKDTLVLHVMAANGTDPQNGTSPTPGAESPGPTVLGLLGSVVVASAVLSRRRS